MVKQKVRLLPTSDIVFKLFTELVRAARRTVESGISSLCGVTFRMRGCQRCHSKLEQHMKRSFLRHLCLRRYFGGVHCILYSSESSARRKIRTPEECESSATYINPNRFLPGVRVLYKGGKVFRQSVWFLEIISQFLQKKKKKKKKCASLVIDIFSSAQLLEVRL